MPAQAVEKRITLATETPSGIQIEYEPEPHTYRVKHKAETDWHDAISVTTALDALNKGGLPWWGMGIGVQGVMTLWDRGWVRYARDGHLMVPSESGWIYATKDKIIDLLKKHKLTVNDVRDEAGDRGQSVHDALEEWVKSGTIPVAEFYPEEEQGYVRGLVKFLGHIGEVKSKPLSEVSVASVEHKFAGRYDLEMVLHGANLQVKLPTPSWTPEGPNHHSAKGPEFEEFNGRAVLDLKTPKGVYASHHLQLALYEGARRECGYPKSEHRIVVRVNPAGDYLAVKSVATYEDGLAVLAVARAVARIEKEAKAK